MDIFVGESTTKMAPSSFAPRFPTKTQLHTCFLFMAAPKTLSFIKKKKGKINIYFNFCQCCPGTCYILRHPIASCPSLFFFFKKIYLLFLGGLGTNCSGLKHGRKFLIFDFFFLAGLTHILSSLHFRYRILGISCS